MNLPEITLGNYPKDNILITLDTFSRNYDKIK